MNRERYASVIDEADRAWAAAWELDEIRGDGMVSEWTALKMRDLIRTGEAEDPVKVGELADALEQRLGFETGMAA